jgi:hypothetical protein
MHASLLQEAVRELEREMERLRLPGKTTDMEYLKNVVLKLFQTGEADSLLPVVATVLQFSPAEVEACRAALDGRGDTGVVAASGGGGGGGMGKEGQATSYIGGLTSWVLGSGGAR